MYYIYLCNGRPLLLLPEIKPSINVITAFSKPLLTLHIAKYFNVCVTTVSTISFSSMFRSRSMSAFLEEKNTMLLLTGKKQHTFDVVTIHDKRF